MSYIHICLSDVHVILKINAYINCIDFTSSYTVYMYLYCVCHYFVVDWLFLLYVVFTLVHEDLSCYLHNYNFVNVV